jgi:hypothetical protein
VVLAPVAHRRRGRGRGALDADVLRVRRGRRDLGLDAQLRRRHRRDARRAQRHLRRARGAHAVLGAQHAARPGLRGAGRRRRPPVRRHRG